MNRTLFYTMFLPLMLTLVCCGPARAELPQESKDMIEMLRRKVAAAETIGREENRVLPPKVYEPGSLLREALVRVRRANRGLPLTEPAPVQVVRSPVPQPLAEPGKAKEYVPGTFLRLALDRLKARVGVSGREKSILYHDDGPVSEEGVSSPADLNDSALVAAVPEPGSASDAPEESPAPVAAVEERLHASSPGTTPVRASQPSVAPVAAAGDEIVFEEETGPVPVVTELRDQGTLDEPHADAPVDAQSDRKSPEDRQINEDLGRLEFRMPHNYRIIVR